jgi:hypothetical protein
MIHEILLATFLLSILIITGMIVYQSIKNAIDYNTFVEFKEFY